MDDEDYRTLIAVVSEEMRTSGAPDLAEERHYSAVDKETGESRLLTPRDRLTEMLEAFGRHLAVQDRETYRTAMFNIRQTVEGAAPEGAIVVLTTDDTEREVDLSQAPNLMQIREDLRRLITRLKEADLRPDDRE